MENVQFFTPALLLQVKIFIIQHSVWCSYTGEGAHSTAFSLIYFFLFPVRGPDAAPAFVKDHTHLCQKLNSVPPTVAHSSGTAGTLKSNNWFQKGSRHAHTKSSVCVATALGPRTGTGYTVLMLRRDISVTVELRHMCLKTQYTIPVQKTS